MNDLIVEDGIAPHLHRGRAIFSKCRRYRYVLERRWDLDLPVFVAVLLNPSKADATRNDPTTTFMLNIARRYGCGSYIAVNLFAFVGTDPRSMTSATDPIGEYNNQILYRYVERSDVLLVAWGTHGTHRDRDLAVIPIVAPYEPLCFGLTKDGHPRFPRALPSTVELIQYEGRKAA